MRIVIGFLFLLSACSQEEIAISHHDLTGHRLLVLQTDYMTGLYAEFFTGSLQFSERQGPAAGDVVLVDGRTGPMLLQRSQSDSLLLLDETLSITDEWPLAAGTNIHDAQIIGQDLFIAAYGLADILILDATGQLKNRISLTDYADADGRPEVHQLHLINNKLYVTLQNLDFSQGLTPQVPDHGRLLVIDPETQIIEADYPIPPNPLTDLILKNSNLYLLGCNGSWSHQNTGGIFQFDPAAPDRGELIIDKESLGGDLTGTHSLAYFEDRLWLTISATDEGSQLVSFNSQGGDRQVHFKTEEWALGCLYVSTDRLWLCDRSAGVSGLRQSTDGFSNLIETRLPPSQLLNLD